VGKGYGYAIDIRYKLRFKVTFYFYGSVKRLLFMLIFMICFKSKL